MGRGATLCANQNHGAFNFPRCTFHYLCAMTSDFFTYDKPKVIQALRYHFITRREIRLMIILVNLFAVASAGLYFFMPGRISPTAFFLSSFLWVVLMLSFWFIMPRTVFRKAQTFQDTFKASFTEEGFGIENERGSRHWAWPELSNWLESPHFFHLYFNPRSFFIIPKDAFAGDAVHEARQVLQQHLKRQ
jgi:hypothetical protein